MRGIISSTVRLRMRVLLSLCQELRHLLLAPMTASRDSFSRVVPFAGEATGATVLCVAQHVGLLLGVTCH